MRVVYLVVNFSRRHQLGCCTLDLESKSRSRSTRTIKLKMEITDLGRYTDAIACLQQTLNEGRKSSNVDIHLMLAAVKKCHTIVQELLLTEQDAFFSTALTSLAGSVSAHANILSKKIKQLKEACKKDILTSQHSGSQTLKSPQSFSTPEDIKSKNGEDFDGRQLTARHNVIESTIVKSKQVRFADVIGLTEAKRSLQDAIIMPLLFPHLFTGGRKPWKRILLFGPPGTGKSRLAHAVSTEVQATFYFVSSTDLMSSWVGESEKLIKELFHHASCQTGQSVIFIDEIDSLCRHRSSREDEGTRRIKTELLIQMDGADRHASDKIFLLCATNCPWDLDTAFLRRFQKRIYIPLPEHAARIELMKLHCQGNSVNLSEPDWENLASQTEGYSGSDLATLTNGALFHPIRDLQIAEYWKQMKDGKWTPCDINSKHVVKAKMRELPPQKVCPRNVDVSDFIKSLQLHRPTVSKEELQKCIAFTSSYGQSG